MNELLRDQDVLPHNGHYRFVRGVEKRRYNKAWFGKRKLHVEHSPLSISDTDTMEEPVQLFKSWPRMVKSKRALNWYHPNMIHKKWKPMMSWKSAPNIPGIQWFDEQDNKQESKIPSTHQKQNLETSEQEARDNILQLPRQLRSFIPTAVQKLNDRRRRAQAFTRCIHCSIL